MLDGARFDPIGRSPERPYRPTKLDKIKSLRAEIPVDALGPVHTIGLNMISLEDGTYRSSIRTNSSLSAGATRQREHVEPPSPQRNSVRRRAWLQVAGLASEVWLLAHSLYPHEPLVQKRSPQSGVRTPSTRADSAHQYRGGFGGQHDCQGASRWHGRVKKNGPQSIGKSRGGWTTKIHMVAADARTALMFSLSAGQAHDAPEGRKLLNRLGPQRENLSIVTRIVHTRATRHANSHWRWDSLPSFRRPRHGSPHGRTTWRCTRDATKLSACSGD